jgi:hypothetical protein
MAAGQTPQCTQLRLSLDNLSLLHRWRPKHRFFWRHKTLRIRLQRSLLLIWATLWSD